MGSSASVADVPQHVLEYLDGQPTLTLATASRGGVPRATTLTYVNDGVNVYVWMRPDTTTARHMDDNPVVSFAIDHYADDWQDTKGIQVSGEAQVVLNPDELAGAVERFERKYPPLAGTLETGVSIFRITPRELQFIDSAASGPSEGGGVSYQRDLVFSVFQDLPQRDIETVAATLQTVQVPAGEVIVRQGAPADKFFIIVDGEVEVVHEHDGETKRLATLTAGQFFGEMAILRDSPRMATVRAVGPATLFAMERDAFRGLVAQSMGTTQDFDQVIQQRMEELRGSQVAR
jgi:nitroimidazol reductase NimA-like FMN-containing flavoprotein (pyridoxamine 5'-phosphate oxidase superfamily)